MWQSAQTRLTAVSDTLIGVENKAETNSDGCKDNKKHKGKSRTSSSYMRLVNPHLSNFGLRKNVQILSSMNDLWIYG